MLDIKILYIQKDRPNTDIRNSLIETAFRMSTVSTNTHDHHSHLTSPITSPWSSANDNLVFDLIENKTEKKISQRYQTDINHGGVN